MLPHAPGALSREERAALCMATEEAFASCSTYPEQVAAANWRAASFPSTVAKLKAARPGVARCVYCEDSEGAQVEHVLPSKLYPSATWMWTNLTMACDTCNGRKWTRHAIVHLGDEHWTNVTRGSRSPVVAQPPPACSAFINPRTEDPLTLIELDLTGATFRLLAREDLDEHDRARVDWTVEECLKLNRVGLLKGRRRAYGSYRRVVEDYLHWRGRPVDWGVALQLRQDFVEADHPTVWAEMKRQRRRIPQLDALFQRAPEALDW